MKPLANPAANSIEFFATVDMLDQKNDRKWLARVTGAIYEHWQGKNTFKKELARDAHRGPAKHPLVERVVIQCTDAEAVTMMRALGRYALGKAKFKFRSLAGASHC